MSWMRDSPAEEKEEEEETVACLILILLLSRKREEVWTVDGGDLCLFLQGMLLFFIKKSRTFLERNAVSPPLVLWDVL